MTEEKMTDRQNMTKDHLSMREELLDERKNDKTTEQKDNEPDNRQRQRTDR